MISTLTGTVLHVGAMSAVIDVNGIGYAVELTVPHAASLTIGEGTTMHTSLVVRQESLTVFGFAGPDEQALFSQLTTVTGVGPRHALSALSTLDVGALARAIQADNDTPFRKVPGIGPKTARMIVMSLKGKVAALVPDGDEPTEHETVDTTARAEATAALLSLGWKQRTANEALEGVFTTDPVAAERMPTAALIRAALAQLS